MVSVVQWDPTLNIDYNLGINTPAGQVYDPLQIRIEIVAAPGGAASYQFDAFQSNGAIALVRNRNLDGSAAAPSAVTYGYFPGATFGQIGTLPNGGGGQRNFEFLDGSVLLVGDGTTGTAADDLANDWSAFAQWDSAIHAYGLGGNDSLYGAAFRDRLLGNLGNDWLKLGAGDDWGYGGRDNDWVLGEDGNDLLFGDLGLDWVVGGNGADTMFGGADNDTLDPGEGDDWAFGGKGDDLYDLNLLGGIKYLYGDDGDDHYDLASIVDFAHLFGGNGNDEFRIGSAAAGLSIKGGAGNNFYDIAGLSIGGSIWGGPDSDDVDLRIQHAGGSLAKYRISLMEGDDRIVVAGVADGLIFDRFRTGSGRDLIDLRAAFFFDRNVYESGDDADTVHGAANGGIYDLGQGADHFFGSGGRDEIRVSVDYALGLDYRLRDWTVGLDKVRFDGSLFGINQVFGYRGNGVTGIEPQDNWFVANDKPYTLSTFVSGFWAGLPNQPALGFGTFFNDATDAIETYFFAPGLEAPTTSTAVYRIADQVLSDLDGMTVEGSPNLLDLQSIAFNF